jgi:NADP-dependent 3-hydroxy acid dehydrogenase YdfG
MSTNTTPVNNDSLEQKPVTIKGRNSVGVFLLPALILPVMILLVSGTVSAITSPAKKAQMAFDNAYSTAKEAYEIARTKEMEVGPAELELTTVKHANLVDQPYKELTATDKAEIDRLATKKVDLEEQAKQNWIRYELEFEEQVQFMKDNSEEIMNSLNPMETAPYTVLKPDNFGEPLGK